MQTAIVGQRARAAHVLLACLVGSTILICTLGCATTPYHAGSNSAYFISPELLGLTQPQIERGKPRPVIDGIGWVLGIPGKIVLWNRRIDNHNISPETEAAIGEYLAVNDLHTVKVRLNQYAPGDDWRRLVANKSVGWGWRYTVGTLTWLGETIVPGRLVGGDHYNPFTNTIHLYSDVPAVAVHEGGHAKDFAGRKYKGTYAVAYAIPGVPLWHEAIATNDALGYMQTFSDAPVEQEGYRVLYPAYGTYVGDAISGVVPAGGLVGVGAVVTGHVAGRVQARRAMKRREIETVSAESPTLESDLGPPHGTELDAKTSDRPMELRNNNSPDSRWK